MQNGRWAKVSSDSIPGEWGPLPAGCSWHPALPQSSADPHHVTQPGKTVPDVGGRADWGLSVREDQLHRKLGQRPPEASRLHRPDSQGLLLWNPLLPGVDSTDPYLRAPEVQEGRCGLVPRVAAHWE